MHSQTLDNLAPPAPSAASGPSVYLETFGCQMNFLDSQLLTSSLQTAGFRFTDSPRSADIILFNTCSVRQHAEHKVFSRLGALARLKKHRPHLILGLLGCMAEAHGTALLRRFPALNILCGPSQLHQLPALLTQALSTSRPQIALSNHHQRACPPSTDQPDPLEPLDLARSFSPQDYHGSAYVRITRGCDKFCSYCLVPLTRGPEIHRPPQHILDECKRLVDAGVLEITLLGQTVNHYRFDHGAAVFINGTLQPQPDSLIRRSLSSASADRRITRFADLLFQIHEKLPELQRLRFITNYPRDFGSDILQVMAACPRICRFLHLPVQSGSNRILQLMNRGYTVQEYRQLIEQARSFLPDAEFATDIITGFPTETDEDHQASLQLLDWLQAKNAFLFKYSPRPGTAAARRFHDDIPDHIKQKRHAQLLALQNRISLRIHQRYVGRTLPVLVHGPSPYAHRQTDNLALPSSGQHIALRISAAPSSTIQLSGRTSTDLIVLFDGPPSLIGKIVSVQIERAAPLTLFGKLVSSTPSAS